MEEVIQDETVPYTNSLALATSTIHNPPSPTQASSLRSHVSHPSAILLGCAEDALSVTTHIASRAARLKAKHEWKVATATIIASHRLSNLLHHSGQNSTSHASTAMEVVPSTDGLSAGKVAVGVQWSKQMTSDEVAALPFKCWLDQLPRLVRS